MGTLTSFACWTTESWARQVPVGCRASVRSKVTDTASDRDRAKSSISRGLSPDRCRSKQSIWCCNSDCSRSEKRVWHHFIDDRRAPFGRLFTNAVPFIDFLTYTFHYFYYGVCCNCFYSARYCRRTEFRQKPSKLFSEQSVMPLGGIEPPVFPRSDRWLYILISRSI